MSASTREATNDYSTGSGPSSEGSEPGYGPPAAVRIALAAVALVAAVLLVVSGFMPLYKITTELATLDDTTGFGHHSIAMALLGVAAVPMALGALRGARPAMWALAGIGVVAIIVAVTVDLPAALDEGLLADTYEGAQAEPATGFFVESAAGVLLLLSGGLMLLLGAERPGAAEEAV